MADNNIIIDNSKENEESENTGSSMHTTGLKKTKGRFRFLIRGLLILLAVLLVFVAINRETFSRVYRAVMLFEPAYIEENFRSMNELFDTSVVKRGNQVSELSYDLRELPELYTYQGSPNKIRNFILRSGTTGLIVLKGDTVLFEDYYRGNTESCRAISWSVAKSVVSALFGIAVDEGYIKDINEPVTNYLDLPEDCGYYGVKIKDVLQMSSGIRFNEDYADFNSDINRMTRAIAFSTPLDDFVASLQPEREPGTYNHYVSMDTQVLGMIIREATGKTLTEYTEEKLWKPLGMEADAYWLVESAGMELAFGGLNAVLRDYARFGLLYLNEGKWEGQQIIPADWVQASVTPDAPHLMPGENSLSNWVMGYGYQWWIPENPDGEYMGIGIYGQAIYVYPRLNIVIAKTSAYADYDIDGDDMEIESVEFFRAIARHFSHLEDMNQADDMRDSADCGYEVIYPDQPWGHEDRIWPSY